MLVDLERVGAAEQDHAGEHVPLHFEPGVRARAEQIAARRIAGADQAGQQHEPIGDFAEPVVHVVDGPAQPEQALHAPSPCPMVPKVRDRAFARLSPPGFGPGRNGAQGQGTILDRRVDVNWKFGWRGFCRWPPGAGTLGTADGRPERAEAPAQPPVTLMWRASAGRRWRRSITKSWPCGLRAIASAIAASSRSLPSDARSGVRRSAASSWPRHM